MSKIIKLPHRQWSPRSSLNHYPDQVRFFHSCLKVTHVIINALRIRPTYKLKSTLLHVKQHTFCFIACKYYYALHNFTAKNEHMHLFVTFQTSYLRKQ